MSERVVALLRGVNVGGKKVEMARLRTMLTDLGFDDVRTYLQSGNAVFSGARLTTKKAEAALEDRLEAAVTKEFDLSCRVLVRTAEELAAAMADDPLLDVVDTPARHLVGFLSAKPEPARVKALLDRDHLPDRAAVVGRHLYLWCPNGISQSPFFKMKLDGSLHVAVTARNWNTVLELAKLVGLAT